VTSPADRPPTPAGTVPVPSVPTGDAKNATVTFPSGVFTGAPFIKIEATKYTEVGYYGRDVESMVRELVDNGIGIVREKERKNVEGEAKQRVEERLLDLLGDRRPRIVEHHREMIARRRILAAEDHIAP
jgi:ATP-dependent protease HslVU (ClpYQ) ATPase subunit